MVDTFSMFSSLDWTLKFCSFNHDERIHNPATLNTPITHTKIFNATILGLEIQYFISISNSTIHRNTRNI